MPTSLAKKLQLKPAQRMVILNAPPGYLAHLAAEMDDVMLSDEQTENAEAVMLFVNNLAQAQDLTPGAIATIKRDGLLWIAYPKRSAGVKTDINRDTLWPVPQTLGWEPVRQVAIDETWSALRFRRTEDIKRR